MYVLAENLRAAKYIKMGSGFLSYYRMCTYVTVCECECE